MDDIYMWSQAIDDLFGCIQTLLVRFAERNINNRSDKCNWVITSVDLLGYKLYEKGRRPLERIYDPFAV